MLGLSIASDRNCNANQRQADRPAPRLLFCLPGFVAQTKPPAPAALGSQLPGKALSRPLCPLPPRQMGLQRPVRCTRETSAIIKGFNDSFAQYWGFVMSLITHFNVHIALPCVPACRLPSPLPRATFIRRHFMKPPITDPRPSHCRGSRAWCCALGGRRGPAGLPAHPVCQERVSAPGPCPSLTPPAG